MQIALLSDIHANLEALNACTTHARERGATRFAFLGDLVGYGADASAVVEIVARQVAEGALAVKGNHDEAVEKASGYFNDATLAAIEWARESLTAEQKRFLAALPLIVRDGDICLVHASAANPKRWDYVDSPTEARRCIDATDAAYTFCGHLHDQALVFRIRTGRMREFRPVPERRSRPRPSPLARDRRQRGPACAIAIQRPPIHCSLIARGGQITFYRVAYDAGQPPKKYAAAPAGVARISRRARDLIPDNATSSPRQHARTLSPGSGSTDFSSANAFMRAGMASSIR